MAPKHKKEKEESKLSGVEESKEPSRKQEGDYVILMETNFAENESYYYFLRVEGNEENLKKLQSQFESVDFKYLDDISIFELDLDHPVSAQTAIEMCKVDLNININNNRI